MKENSRCKVGAVATERMTAAGRERTGWSLFTAVLYCKYNKIRKTKPLKSFTWYLV